MSHPRLRPPRARLALLACVAASGFAIACCGSDEGQESDAADPTESASATDSPSPMTAAAVEEAATGKDEADDTPAGNAPKPPASEGRPYESQLERLTRIVQGPVASDSGFQVTVLSLSLEEGVSKNRYGNREKGIQLKLAGVAYNRTGRTLTDGIFGGALVLRFGDKVSKVRISPDGFKKSVSPDNPWRDTQSRLFRIETYVYPEIMLEYEPTAVEARVFVSFRDPVDYEITAPIWKADLNWLAARVAPVKGEAQVFQTDKIEVGPRGKAAGKLSNGEVVQLLYQSGDHFRVKANEGVGWVPSKALVVKNLGSIYQNAAPHAGDKAASDEAVAITVHGLTTTDDVPRGVKVKDGERFVLVDVELNNKGEKDVKCSDFFLDFGPKRQRGPARETDRFEGALSCPKDKLGPGETARGKLAFSRERHDVPVAIGYASPTKGTLLVDVYDVGQAKPYRK